MRRAVLTSLLAGTALALTGCGRGQTRSTSMPDSGLLAMGHQGASWDVVFAIPEAGVAQPGFEAARRDGDLSVLTRQPLNWTDEWPTASRPTLDRQRQIRLHLNTRDSFIYFKDERRRR